MNARTAALAASLLLIAASFLLPPVTVQRPVFDVLAVVDITGSMMTQDQRLHGAAVSRIEMEKAALQAMLARMPCGSRLGLGVFAEERPFILLDPVEICGNAAPLRQSIGGINWMMGWDSESHIAGGLKAAMIAAASRGADLVFMTDGQEMPPLSWSPPVAFSAVRGRVSGLVVGVGGTDFVPIPKFDRKGRQVGVWRAGELPQETGGLFKGHEHLTAVDAPHLRALSQATGLTYVTLTGPDLFPAMSRALPRRVQAVQSDIRYLPCGLAFALLVAACWPRRAARGNTARAAASRAGDTRHSVFASYRLGRKT